MPYFLCRPVCLSLHSEGHGLITDQIELELSQYVLWCSEFPIGTAVALSNVTIVGGAISNFCFNIGRKHPLLPRPLIDWDLILVMEPATIFGALVGGFLNRVCPC